MGRLLTPWAGFYQNYGRNKLNIAWNAGSKGNIDRANILAQFGNSGEQNKISDKLYEWNTKIVPVILYP
jgi:hypothetical protein